MIKQLIKENLEFPILLVTRQIAKDELSKLQSHESEKVRLIGDTLNEVFLSTRDVEEKEACTLIERRRSSLLNSHKEISVLDYGAGGSDSNRDKEEMRKGVPSKALVGDITKASKPEFWAAMLFKLVRKLKPVSCVELGSCVGISSAYQGAALRLNGKGNLTTLEGSPEIANVAKETLEDLNLNNTSVVVGPFHDTLKSVLASSKPVDFFFNDGHHDHDAVIEYFNTAMPYFSNETVVVVDDISWSPGMKKAWNEIENDTRVSVSIDLGKVGIACIGDGAAKKEQFKIRIPL